ncbi:LuxR C-terminal-related transcriptional regulator [Azospirillum picis]|uniref:Two-component system nitrate/nitrite response regulator NarL n=1 Tax=Azospirillum picis TaxID=488438 RepID=A0ABU0MID8_9PROT|nr:response regulator transcription factor [Azospirillum picis]MBP2299366.1 two-component system nitrate/nitrite response regulator NarL [Azospirillum picis]MDQ0532996.1 two-component system nitrate/nitrite response regulator NarL [Azospirillum picis]
MPNRIRVIVHNQSRLLRESILNILDDCFEVIDPQSRLAAGLSPRPSWSGRLNGGPDRISPGLANASVATLEPREPAGPPGQPPERTADIVLFDLASLKTDAWNFRSWYGEQAKLAMIADEFSAHHMRMALRFGVRGYLLNRMAPTAFVLALRLIHAGEPVVPEECFEYFSPTALRRTSDDGSVQQHETELLGYPGLYPRHARILKLIMDGCSNKEIAREMLMTEDLVKLHVRHIMQTINVRNRTQAALWAAQSGIIQEMEYFLERSAP